MIQCLWILFCQNHLNKIKISLCTEKKKEITYVLIEKNKVNMLHINLFIHLDQTIGDTNSLINHTSQSIVSKEQILF